MNPHIINPIQNQGHFGVNVWCGMVGRHLIGPYFFDHCLTAVRYLEFLQNDLPILLEAIHLRRNMLWFQQDGAPAHNSRIVQEHLNEHFEGRWMGTRGPVQWPPRSPDLTPLDFFLWGTIKNIVYESPSNDIDGLKQKIVDACESLRGNILQKVTTNEVRKRLTLCAEKGGGYVEHLIC